MQGWTGITAAVLLLLLLRCAAPAAAQGSRDGTACKQADGGCVADGTYYAQQVRYYAVLALAANNTLTCFQSDLDDDEKEATGQACDSGAPSDCDSIAFRSSEGAPEDGDPTNDLCLLNGAVLTPDSSAAFLAWLDLDTTDVFDVTAESVQAWAEDACGSDGVGVYFEDHASSNGEGTLACFQDVDDFQMFTACSSSNDNNNHCVDFIDAFTNDIDPACRRLDDCSNDSEVVKAVGRAASSNAQNVGPIPNPPDNEPPAPDEEESGSNVGAIAGGIGAGAAVVLAILAGICCFCWRKKKADKNKADKEAAAKASVNGVDGLGRSAYGGSDGSMPPQPPPGFPPISHPSQMSSMGPGMPIYYDQHGNAIAPPASLYGSSEAGARQVNPGQYPSAHNYMNGSQPPTVFGTHMSNSSGPGGKPTWNSYGGHAHAPANRVFITYQSQQQQHAVTTLSELRTQTLASNVGPDSEPSSILEAQLDYLERNCEGMIMPNVQLDSRKGRRGGGQGAVAFARLADDVNKEFAIKFFFSDTAFDRESSIANIPGICEVMPPIYAIENRPEALSTAALPPPLNCAPLPKMVVVEKGESLDEFVERAAPDFFTAIQFLVHIAEKLKTLHDSGWVHRDLKPANTIWLPSTNRWALIDFGCACETEQQAELSFSPYYAPPEVIQAYKNGQATITAQPAADIWSFGVMSYELLTRTKFFGPDADMQSTMDQLSGARPLVIEQELPLEVKKGLGNRAYRNSILAMLNRDPAARPTIGQLVKEWKAVFQQTTFGGEES